MAHSSESNPLSWVHAGRLRAAARELVEMVAQLTAIAGEGQEPARRGTQSFTPLPTPVGVAFTAQVAEIGAAARRVEELAGPEAVAAAPPNLGATRAALNARLGRLEDTLRDLDPARLQAKYGDLPPTVAAELRTLCDGMAERVRDARAILDQMG